MVPAWRDGKLVFAVTVDSSALLDHRVMVRGRLTGTGGHVFANAEFGLAAPLKFHSPYMDGLKTSAGGEFFVVLESKIGTASDQRVVDDDQWDRGAQATWTS